MLSYEKDDESHAYNSHHGDHVAIPGLRSGDTDRIDWFMKQQFLYRDTEMRYARWFQKVLKRFRTS